MNKKSTTLKVENERKRRQRKQDTNGGGDKHE